jgi:hypothetical protein
MMRCTSDESSIASVAATKGLPSQQDGNSQGGKEQDSISQEGKRLE